MSSPQCWLLAIVAFVQLHSFGQAAQAHPSDHTTSIASGVHFTINLHEIKIGHTLVIGGKSIEHATGLNMSFYGANKQNIIFQIFLNWGKSYSSNEIVMNTRHLESGWGSETRASILNKANRVIVKSGDHFKIRIHFQPKGLLVKANDIDVIYYPHRMPISDIRSFGIPYRNGLEQIMQFDHRAIYPKPIPIVHPPLCRFKHCIYEFSNDIPERFVPGDLVIITATPYGSENGQFWIEFTEADTLKQALHFNARFHPEYVVVRNSMNDNMNFGVEERDGDFPFVIDHQFKLVIAFEEDKFQFFVDERYFGSFKYRTENQLAVLNGIKLTSKLGLRVLVTDMEHKHLNHPECIGPNVTSYF